MNPSDPGGRALGSRYELVEVIGAGAMGKVWRAWDRTDQKYLAAKVLRSELTSDPEILARFIQERSILLGLRHPNIVEVSDLVVEGDSLAIVMDLVEGPGLRGLMQSEGTLAPAVALQVAASVLDALAVAHAAGTLHRDVKPDNILLASDRDSIADAVKLTDFGIARLAQESTVQATGLLGTPSYMPPELFERGVTSAASDVYAVGIMLYEMLAGRTPFAGNGTAHTMGFRHLTALPPQLDLDPAVWAALETMLAKDPRKRLSAAATAAQLRELAPAVEGRPAGPRQSEPSDWERVPTDVGEVQRDIRPQALSSTDDVGGTRIRGGSGPDPVARPIEGSVEALIPAAAPGDGFTQVRAEPMRRAESPTLTSEVVHRPKRRKVVYWISAIAAVLVLVAGGLVLGGVFSHGHGAAKASVGAAANASDDQTTSWANGGLTYGSQATYQPGQGVTLSLKLTYQYPITGNLMFVIPAIGSSDTSQCASVTWTTDSATSQDLEQASQNAVPCGYELTPTGGGTGSDSLTLTAQVAVSTSPTASQLSSWLQAIDSDTASRVQAYAGDKSEYVLQEITGISVDVNRQSARYVVSAKWAGTPESQAGTPSSVLLDSSQSTNIAGPLATLFGVPGGNHAVGVRFSSQSGFLSVGSNGNCGASLDPSNGVFNPGPASCSGTITATIFGKLKGQGFY